MVQLRQKINGVLLLDKPKGFTSNQCLQQLKRIYNAKKAGHSGTLDPLATGLLPVCFGEATKFLQYILEADKAYVVEGKLGTITDSADAAGKILQDKLPTAHINAKLIQEVLPQLTGEITQLPPMHSAIKVDGRRLYEFAHAGEVRERPSRRVVISSLELLNYCPESLTFTLKVACSKGTYIRTLVEDLAKAMGTGAYVLELVRTQAAHFCIDQSITLSQLKVLGTGELHQQLLPVDALLPALPDCKITQEQTQSLYFGKPVSCGVIEKALSANSNLFKLYDENGFLGVAERYGASAIKAKRLLADTSVSGKTT